MIEHIKTIGIIETEKQNNIRVDIQVYFYVNIYEFMSCLMNMNGGR